MEAIASYCLTEPGAGSDAAALRTRAVRDGDDYVLDGVKQFISGAGTSDVYVVMARTGVDGPRGISAFVVEKDTPGLEFRCRRAEDGLERPAHRAGDPRRRAGAGRRDARRPEGEGTGFGIAMSGLNGGRLNIAACSLGGAQAAHRQGRALRPGPGGVRRCAARRADHPVHARRHGHRAGDRRAHCCTARRSSPGRRRARQGRVVRDGQAVRHRRLLTTSPIRRCSCTAATATCGSTGSRRSFAICGCTESSRAPTKSCAWSSDGQRRPGRAPRVEGNTSDDDNRVLGSGPHGRADGGQSGRRRLPRSRL